MRGIKFLYFLSILLASCDNTNSNTPTGILKKEKMQAALWDVLRADAFAFQFTIKDSSKKPEAEVARLQQEAFAMHKITREQFYKSLDYYKLHPEIFQPMIDSMINKYTKEKYSDTASRKPGQSAPIKIAQ